MIGGGRHPTARRPPPSSPGSPCDFNTLGLALGLQMWRVMFAHFVAHTRPGLVPLATEAQARWLWCRLPVAFPKVLGVTLMPDHLHLIALLAGRARRRLATLLGAFSRRFDLGEVWRPVPEPSLCTTTDKLQRALRYVALNPVRPWRHGNRIIKLVSDPLMWPWSTLRDVVGATVQPWVDADQLASQLGWVAGGFRRRFHRYVSSDPHVDVKGTPFPSAAAPSALPSRCFADLQRAALASTRLPVEALRQQTPARSLLVALAYRQGWGLPARLADLCGIHPRSVARLARRCPEPWLDAASLCLGDERLLAGSSV
jgi:hypothetical protein